MSSTGFGRGAVGRSPTRILSLVLLGLCVAVVVSGAILWTFGRDPYRGAISAAPARETGDSYGNAGAAHVAPSDPDGVRARAEDAEHPMLLADSAVDVGTENGSREALDTLRSELEATLYERMDPSALLAVAQRVADSVVDLKVNSQPTIDGGVRFDLVGVPEGMSAGLEVHRSAKYSSILDMEIQCDQTEPTFLEGAYRRAPTLRIKVWRDGEGNPSNMVICTKLAPAYRESLSAGIDINHGTTTCGLTYHLDMGEPSNSGMKLLVMKDGLLTEQEVPANLYGGAWPQMDDVGHFAGTLLALQQSLDK